MLKNNGNCIEISLNQDSLSTLIRGNLSSFYNQIMSVEVIDLLTKQLLESINNFVTKEEEKV